MQKGTDKESAKHGAKKNRRRADALNAAQKILLASLGYVLVFALVVLFLISVSSCASQTENNNKITALYCLGFCAHAEVDHESTVETDDNDDNKLVEKLNERRTGNERDAVDGD